MPLGEQTVRSPLFGRSTSRVAHASARRLLDAAGENCTLEALEARKLLAVDPISPDHDLWTIPVGNAVIDGVLDDADWGAAHTEVRIQPYYLNSRATVRMMYNEGGIFLSVDVTDAQIWADGNGNGNGNIWEIETDDSATFYFDVNNSRDEWFQSTDRAFGANLGSRSGSDNGAGAVRRVKFVQGDGLGGAPSVPGLTVDQLPAYASRIDGTVNNNADADRGWIIEMFVPFAQLGMAAPTHGTTIGMNFDIIFDQTGGTRDLTDRRFASGADRAQRFGPGFIDDQLLGEHSSYTATGPGIHGPVAYAEVMFVDSRAGAKPAAVTNLGAANTSAFGTQLTFNAPAGTTGGLGSVSGYEIRYSTSPITDERSWLAATRFEHGYTPRLAGLSERLRLTGLTPSTQYFVAVRAVDALGNLGDLSNATAFTTAAKNAVDDKGRVVPSPSGGTFMTEDGDALVVVGDHLGLPWAFTRNLYPGDVYNPGNGQLINFHTDPSYEGTADSYFQLLQTRGINTMRVYLELIGPAEEGNPFFPNGSYYLESPFGAYNAAMQQFVYNLLDKADQYGMYLIFSPFDSFFYDEVLTTQSPLYTGNGGPLSDINSFFQTPGTLAWAKSRMDIVTGWVAQSANSDRLIGWEVLSEWDSGEWTTPELGNPAITGDQAGNRARAAWITEMNDYVRSIDPNHLTLMSTIERDPRGPIARSVFNSRSFDAYTSHMYTPGNQEPINNPASDKTIAAAVQNATLTAYWLSNRISSRPFLVGEWGMSRADWPNGQVSYREGYTAQDDEALFRAVLWSGLASGQAGTGLRINTEELAPNAYILTDPLLEPTSPVNLFNIPGNMRPIQQTLGRFVNSNTLAIDWARFNPRSLGGLIAALSASGKSLLAFGATDGAQGLAYVMQDRNVTSGSVTDGVLTIAGLDKNRLYDIEFWSTDPGVTAALAALQGVYAGDGKLTFALPAFAVDLAVKFRARPSTVQTQGVVATSVGSQALTFIIGPDQQPKAVVTTFTGSTPTTGQIDIAGAANFRGRVVDMTVFVVNGRVHLAITDDHSQLWVIAHSGGDVMAGTWTATNMTWNIGAPGLSGDLTTYQPSWGSIHVAGLDARGHAINYWWAPGLPKWQYADLTAAFDGPVMAGGLTGYVSSWDGLNLAGLNADGEVIVYWWAPGLAAILGSDRWATVNMTTAFNGPRLTGSLDAFVTPWGGLNIAGTDADGSVFTYWWAPGLTPDPDTWRVSNISEITGAPPMVYGTKAAVTTDGAINLLALGPDRETRLLRWDIPTDTWSQQPAQGDTDPLIEFPLGTAALGQRLLVAGRTEDSELVMFWYDISLDTWSVAETDILIVT